MIGLILIPIYQKVIKHLKFSFKYENDEHRENKKTDECALEEKMCLFSLCNMEIYVLT